MDKNKKFGVNTKKEAGRLRKLETKNAKNAKIKQDKEDAYWQDDNNGKKSKEHKKLEKEIKRRELLARKQKLKELAQAEENKIKADLLKKNNKIKSSKITLAQIKLKQENEKKIRLVEKKAEELKKQKIYVQSNELHENTNHNIDDIEADTIEDAILALQQIGISENSNFEIDRHPEKRVKAAWKAYLEKRIPEIKADRKGLKLSQIKQIIYKEFQKSPENPLVAAGKK